MKFYFAIFTMLLSPIILSAQTRDLSINQISYHVNNCLQKNYRPDSTSIAKLCRKACIFIKFKVNKNGKISGLSFGKDSAFFIKEALSKAISFLQKDNRLINTLRRSGKVVIQPFVYDYELACAFPSGDHSIDENERNKLLVSFLLHQLRMQQYESNILNILNFNNSSTDAIDCILLKPYFTVAVRKEPSY